LGGVGARTASLVAAVSIETVLQPVNPNTRIAIDVVNGRNC
jgi:hypothetical protein